eukprot:TRINITY_DN4761_c0_g1_i2.p1 TRINITY_DN4761_c0_g1~~TRINITY_DN4761_c0_g1_i2.p1  ORF type:complete len:410 (+),score=120.39 TRINITY_DN4761_c0_g1_i2:221-1450(+)
MRQSVPPLPHLNLDRYIPGGEIILTDTKENIHPKSELPSSSPMPAEAFTDPILQPEPTFAPSTITPMPPPLPCSVESSLQIPSSTFQSNPTSPTLPSLPSPNLPSISSPLPPSTIASHPIPSKRKSEKPAREPKYQKKEDKSTHLMEGQYGETIVRGRVYTSDKPPLFNHLWTDEEQARLEALLHEYPDEPISSHRWQKIATALGRRTPKQVASRTQKYFIKLAKQGLPIPGRMPNMEVYAKKKEKKKKKVKAEKKSSEGKKNKNSTRDLDYYTAPPVHMSSDDEEDDMSDMHDTEEYKELMKLYQQNPNLKKGEVIVDTSIVTHPGYKCDGCGVEPIVGIRYSCEQCDQVDLCSTCAPKIKLEGNHTPSHRMKMISEAEKIPYYSSDYSASALENLEPNYLDPSYMAT